MASIRQIQANLRNSSLSTGPKTEQGRRISRANAVKHGLACLTLLPDQMEEIVADRIAEFSITFPPANDLDQFYIERAAVESVRIEQAVFQQHELVAKQVRRAESCWEQDRSLEAARLIGKLPANPEVIARELECTKHGCELMIGRWESLRCVLVHSKQPWNEVHRGMALDLLGVGADFRLVRYATVTTVDAQDALAAAEIARLKRYQTEWLEAIDDADRETVTRGAANPDREIWRVRRYEDASLRRFNQAMRHLKGNQPKESGKTSKPMSAESFSFVVEPERTNPLDEPAMDLDAMLEAMRRAVGPGPEPEPEPVVDEVDTVFEEALAAPVPAKQKGNRKQRRARAHKMRQMAHQTAC